MAVKRIIRFPASAPDDFDEFALALYGVLLRALDKHKERDAILAKDIDRNYWKTHKVEENMVTTRIFFHRLESHFLKE